MHPYEIRWSIEDSTEFDFRDLTKDCRPGEVMRGFGDMTAQSDLWLLLGSPLIERNRVIGLPVGGQPMVGLLVGKRPLRETAQGWLIAERER